MQTKPKIFITNDDSIASPGLWAAIEALDPLGELIIVAPKEQQTSMGRAFPRYYDCKIEEREHVHKGKTYICYSINGSPAQAVAYGILKVVGELPNLVVSGINYGENIGSGVTISGTVGAALEGSTFGVPALAVSLEVPAKHHLSLNKDVDFSTSAWFTAFFAKKALAMSFPPDVDVLKIEVPENATPATPWVVTRQSRRRYYTYKEGPSNDDGPDYRAEPGEYGAETRTDVQVLVHEHKVSVTPLSIDLTSRIDLDELHDLVQKVR